MLEQKEKGRVPEGGQCKFNCADTLCVRTCFRPRRECRQRGAERLSSTLGVIPGNIDLAKTIDHTLLKPDATQDQIAQLCLRRPASTGLPRLRQPHLGETVCPIAQGLAGKGLHGDRLPARSNLPGSESLRNPRRHPPGCAVEIDMVINIGALKARDLELVAQDIRGVVGRACRREPSSK